MEEVVAVPDIVEEAADPQAKKKKKKVSKGANLWQKWVKPDSCPSKPAITRATIVTTCLVNDNGENQVLST